MSTNFEGPFRKLFERCSSKWLRLPAWVRGYGDEMLRYAERPDGRVCDSTDPEDVAAVIRAHADEIERVRDAMGQLGQQGYLVERDGQLFIDRFPEGQANYEAIRKAAWRKANREDVPDSPGPTGTVPQEEMRSEKIRSEDPPVVPPSEGPTQKITRKRRQTSGTPAPESLEPNAATLRCAQEMGLDPVREIAACLDFHRGKGSIQVDWQATARTWFRKAADFAGQRRPPGMAIHQETRQTPAHRPVKLMPSKHDGQVTAAEFAEMARKIGRQVL